MAVEHAAVDRDGSRDHAAGDVIVDVLAARRRRDVVVVRRVIISRQQQHQHQLQLHQQQRRLTRRRPTRHLRRGQSAAAETQGRQPDWYGA